MPNVRKTKKPVRRPRRNTRRPKRSVPRSIASLVSKAINRNLETKMVSTTYNFTGFNSAINAIGDYVGILPPVLAGTGQNARIGSEIKPIKLVLRGYIAYRADTYSNARMLGTRLFCFSDKSVNSYTVSTSAGQNYRLIDQGGTSSTFDGTALSYMQPHNTDAFKWYADKKHTILKPTGLTNTLTGTSEITSMHTSMYKPFTIVISGSKLPASLKYDDSLSTNQPVNFAPYLAFGYCDLLNYIPDTATTQVGMEWVATLYYKDA